MALVIPKLIDDRTLAQIHQQLMDDLIACDNMIGIEPSEDDTEQEFDYRGEMDSMLEQLLTL